MLRGYQIIDADGHVMEPPDLWEKRLEPQFMSGRPMLRDGTLYYEGQRWPGKLTAEVRADSERLTELHYQEYLKHLALRKSILFLL